MKFGGIIEPKAIYKIYGTLHRRMIVWGALLLAFGLYVILEGMHDGKDITMMFQPLIIGACLAGYPFWIARKLLASDKALFQPIEGEATESRLQISSARGSLSVAWKDVHGVRIFKQFALIYTNALVAQLLPRSFFKTDEEWEQFKTFAQINSPRRMPPWVIAVLVWVCLIVLVLLGLILFK